MILWGFRKNEQGVIVSRLFDSDNFPAGWFDSPDKIDPPQKEWTAESEPTNWPQNPPDPSDDNHPDKPTAKGTCPKCGKHIGRGIGFHKKRCEG